MNVCAAYSRTSYKIVPLTNVNKCLHNDTSETEVNINIVNSGSARNISINYGSSRVYIVLQLSYIYAPCNLPYFFPCSSHSLFYLHILVYTWSSGGFEYQLMVRFGLPIIITYLLNYLLTPWSRVLLEKPTSNFCS
jgi:hypothetical protein